MYHAVIVPLDGSELAERALAPAVAVARASGAQIQLIRVVEDGAVAAAYDYLTGIGSGLGAETRNPYVIEGDWPAECIANAAEEPDALLCMTSHGGSGLRRAILGSTAEDVLKLIRSHALIVGPHVEQAPDLEHGKIVVAVNGSEAADSIVPVAARWCQQFSLEPWFVTVIEPDVVPLRDVTGDTAADVTEAAHAETLARRWNDAGIPANWEAIRGANRGHAIAEFCASLPAAVVAITASQRSTLTRVALGSTSADVVRHASCPVLLLQPPDDVQS